MNHIQPDPTDIDLEADDEQSEDPSNMTGVLLDMVIELDMWWGNARLGMVLCAAHFNRQPVTTEQIADLLGVATETVRKHLKPLMNTDRVRVLREGRNVRYRARALWARRTLQVMTRHRQIIIANDPILAGSLRQRWVFPKPLIPFELRSVD